MMVRAAEVGLVPLVLAHGRHDSPSDDGATNSGPYLLIDFFWSSLSFLFFFWLKRCVKNSNIRSIYANVL